MMIGGMIMTMICKTKKRNFPYEIIPILMMTLAQFKTLTMDEHVEQYQIQKNIHTITNAYVLLCINVSVRVFVK